MVLYQSPLPDHVDFRNGHPVRMTGWLNVRIGRLNRKQNLYGKLMGEVLSFHTSEKSIPIHQFNVVGNFIDRRTTSKRSIRIANGRHVYTIYFLSTDEMQQWVDSIQFASNRCFDKYYTLGALLAEGTYSRVYYAYPLNDPKKLFVVKIIRKRVQDCTALEWVHRERHCNSVLNHPHVVQAVDMFSTVERDHIVFELMRGGTLEDLLQNVKHNRLPESYARVIMRQLLSALNHIHAKNIVHRDIRPGNVFCSDSKFPMSIGLGDFGYATFLEEKFVNRDVLTTLIGVPPYISVDIVRRVKYGPAADMWSAGVLLFEMLTGEVPFRGKNDRAVLERIKKGTVKFDHPVWKNISPDAELLVRQLLQVDPHIRISALASLQHRWFHEKTLSKAASINTSCTTSPTKGALAFSDRDSPSNTSSDSRRLNQKCGSISNLSRIPSSSSSQSPYDSSSVSERQTSLLGSQQPSLRSMQPVSSTSSLGLPRMQMTPSVRAIAEKGLHRVASDNPGRMKRLLSSRVVQKQLAIALPYRRKLIVLARVFVAVFRLRALKQGNSATRQLSVMENGNIDDINALIERRKQVMVKANEARKLGPDRSTGPLQNAHHHGQKRGHVRKKSRDVVSHFMGRVSIERKSGC